MSFQPTTTLPPNPLVRVFFSGLMVIKPLPDGTCEISVNRIAGPPNHDLTIEVRQKQPGHRDIILARIVGPLRVPVPNTQSGVTIQTVQAGGITAFVGTKTTDNEESLIKAVDLNHFHPGKTQVSEFGRPSILMNDAIFYAADITDPDLIIDLYQGLTFKETLTPFAGLIGANIYSTTEVQWMQEGGLKRLPLQAGPTGSGLNYEIYVINDPLFDPPLTPGQQPHDELQEYYKILPQVPPGERLQMVFRKIPQSGRGSSRTPCMSVIDNGTP